ncbi:MAG: pantoate--beta-alanine ligase [Xanthomonadales bacterium]|nr:pantoate--beta-alanine ligase [Xanthomonadales bacterium]
MKTFTSIADWKSYRDTLQESPLGFVPTMGALHEGHLSLVKTSKEQNALTMVSVFVNPTQFDDKQDFEKYPVESLSDLVLLRDAGVDVVLLPDKTQVYRDDYRFKVTESEFSQRLCGTHRPGHFDGVLTVVMRLLNLVRPDHAYFGEKDYQQLQLIRDMVSAFFMPVKIVACTTVREADGLAMSSRNQHLDARNRDKAAELYAALKHNHTAVEARQALIKQGFVVDYVEDIATRRVAAVRLGSTRLIDNVEI